MIKENDFVEIEYTGFIKGSNEVFDTTDEKVAKENGIYNENSKYGPIKVVAGRNYIIPGLDKALIGKEEGKEFEVDVNHKEAFGERKREMIRTIPLKSFTEQKVNPQTGMVLTLDNALVKIIAVSGARVITDFNNPLAGKNLRYKITMIRRVTENKEKAETLLNLFFRFVPDFDIKEHKVIVKGIKELEAGVKLYKEKFKELSGLDLEFEEKLAEKKKDEKNLEAKLQNNEENKGETKNNPVA